MTGVGSLEEVPMKDATPERPAECEMTIFEPESGQSVLACDQGNAHKYALYAQHPNGKARREGTALR